MSQIFNLDDHRKQDATVALISPEDELLSFLSVQSKGDNYYFTEEPEEMKRMSFAEANRIAIELAENSDSIDTIDLDTNEAGELFNTDFRFEAVTIDL